jgi:hypothetical protein
MRTQILTPLFTEYIPAEPRPGHLYISMQFETAVHLCACGCNSKVVTPFGPHDWAMTFDGTVSLRPSVGNGQHPCRSHYCIRNDRVAWLPPISAETTQTDLARDQASHVQATSSARVPWWRRAWDYTGRWRRVD